jgi:hypothetical protein
MKKLFFMALLLCLFTNVNVAQSTDSTLVVTNKETKTLFNSIKPKVKTLGLYVAPSAQYFGAVGAYSAAQGTSFMLLFNQRFAIGASGNFSSYFTPSALNNAGLRMQYATAGAQLEYTFAPHRLIHFSVPLLVGAGMARVDSTSSVSSHDDDDDWDWHGKGRNRRSYAYEANPFFIVQPGLNIEMNVFRFAKLFIGANYRAVIGNTTVAYPVAATTAKVTNSQLSGASFQIGVKLGYFDWKVKKNKGVKE